MNLQGIWHLWNDGVLRGAQHVFFKMMYSLRPWNFNADAHHVYKMTRRTITSWNFFTVINRPTSRSVEKRPLYSALAFNTIMSLQSPALKDDQRWINMNQPTFIMHVLILSHHISSSYVIVRHHFSNVQIWMLPSSFADRQSEINFRNDFLQGGDARSCSQTFDNSLCTLLPNASGLRMAKYLYWKNAGTWAMKSWYL